MEIIPKSGLQDETSKVARVVSPSIKCFVETPSKTGKDILLNRICAFDLFNLFTVDIIRSKVVFTR